MRYVFSVWLFVCSIAWGLFGLLFLLGSKGRLWAIVVGIVILVSCVGIIKLALSAWRSAARRSPSAVRHALYVLAKDHGGIVNSEQVYAAFGTLTNIAHDELRKLGLQGQCRIIDSAGVRTFEFPSLRATVIVRRCPYCGWEAALTSATGLCPRCGGAVEETRLVDSEAINLS